MSCCDQKRNGAGLPMAYERFQISPIFFPLCSFSRSTKWNFHLVVLDCVPGGKIIAYDFPLGMIVCFDIKRTISNRQGLDKVHNCSWMEGYGRFYSFRLVRISRTCDRQPIAPPPPRIMCGYKIINHKMANCLQFGCLNTQTKAGFTRKIFDSKLACVFRCQVHIGCEPLDGPCWLRMRWHGSLLREQQSNKKEERKKMGSALRKHISLSFLRFVTYLFLLHFLGAATSRLYMRFAFIRSSLNNFCSLIVCSLIFL